MQGLRLTPCSCSDIDDLSLLGLWCLGLSNGAVGYWHWVLVLGFVCASQAVEGMAIGEDMSWTRSVRYGVKHSSAR